MARQRSSTTPTDFVTAFVAELRTRAADPLVADSTEAKAVRRVADELEAHYAAHQLTAPTMAEAVAASGDSDVELRRLKREGKWSGQRADLPRRPTANVPHSEPSKRPTLVERRLLGQWDW